MCHWFPIFGFEEMVKLYSYVYQRIVSFTIYLSTNALIRIPSLCVINFMPVVPNIWLWRSGKIIFVRVPKNRFLCDLLSANVLIRIPSLCVIDSMPVVPNIWLWRNGKIILVRLPKNRFLYDLLIDKCFNQYFSFMCYKLYASGSQFSSFFCLAHLSSSRTLTPVTH